MRRLTRLRVGWVAGLGIAGTILGLTLPFHRFSLLTNLLIILTLLVPGRLQGYLYRDFFRGRRLSDQKRYDEAIPCYDAFLTRVRAAPWLKHAIWLSWPGYSTSMEAVTLTNLGAAELELGNLDAAEERSHQAIAVDPHTPIPWYNLGMIHMIREDPARAADAMAKARELGYRGSVLDRIQQRLASLLARVEGSGAGASPEAGA